MTIYKKLFLPIFFFINYSLCVDPNLSDSQKPLLVLSLMVKNEEHNINATLEPFVKEGVDSYFIFDTGSTDKTIETVQKYFEQNNINNGHVVQEPFIDFSISRNRALELTREKFPSANFILMIDAEWYVQNVKELIDFCKNNINNPCPAYLMRGDTGGENFYAARLMRTDAKVYFDGPVHEALITPTCQKLPHEVVFNYRPTPRGKEATAQRWQRDLAVIIKYLETHPNSTRYTFYLAQTYECLGDMYNAYKYYEIRSKQLGGFDEETYEAVYRLGRVCDMLSKIDKNFTWHMAFDYYAQAFKLRPHRSEPIVRIAEHYWPDNIPMCFLFAKRALDFPYPKQETLFVDREVYDYTRHEIISKSAWHVNEFEIGEQETKEALKQYEMPHLFRNLAAYLERKMNQNK